MPEAVINLIKGDKVGAETDYRDALPVNMYGVLRPILGVNGYMLQASGLTQYGDSSGVTNGAVNNERFHTLFRVQGSELVSVTASGDVDVLGSLGAVTSPCAMPYSFNTQGVVASGRFFLYSPSEGLKEVTDPDLGNPIDCVWIDGYYFFTDGENLYHTDITNESSIDPLKFATAEFMPDESLGLGKTQDNKVIVFGRYSIEYLINQASDNFAFSRLPTRAQKIGIVATHAKVEVNGVWYIVGGRKEEQTSVHVLTVGQSAKIASREVDKILSKYTEQDLSNIWLDTMTEDDVTLVIFHLPNETLVYNATLGEQAGTVNAWSIYKSDVDGDRPWRAKHIVFHPEKGAWVCGDKIDGRLGVIDSEVSTQYGDIAEWLLYTPFASIEAASINKLAIETISGFTASDDATVFASMTYDGVYWGKEWSINYGKPGSYGKRFIAHRLGYVRDIFALKLRGASRSRMAFSKAIIDYD